MTKHNTISAAAVLSIEELQDTIRQLAARREAALTEGDQKIEAAQERQRQLVAEANAAHGAIQAYTAIIHKLQAAAQNILTESQPALAPEVAAVEPEAQDDEPTAFCCG